MHTLIYMSSAHKMVGTNTGLRRVTVAQDTALVVVGILDFCTECAFSTVLPTFESSVVE